MYTAQDYLEALPYLTPEERAEIDSLIASSPPDPAYWESERAKCAADAAYFISTYVWIYDNESAAWVRFGLWPEQREALDLMGSAQQTVFLKARQLGLSWLSLSKILHESQFRPITSANIFSLRENEAAYLLGRERFRGMWERLPMPLRSAIASDNVTHLGFANGSHVRAFPTTAGDSYAATLALVDEADLVPDLNRLLRRVKPSIDAGGRIMLVSRSDKANPESEFKRIYRAARAGKTDWKAMFLPWMVRPGRTPEWYAAQCRDALANTGSLDDVHEQYPACVTAETRVSTERGILPIAEALDCRETESGSIISATVQPTSQIFRLETEGGRVLRGTFDHPVMTDDGFVALSELQPGRVIQLRPPRFAEEGYVERWNPIPGTESTIRITPEWGRFIGLFMGDGCWYKGTVEIACDGKDEDVLADASALCALLIREPTHRTVARIPGRKGCTYIRVGATGAQESFRRLGLIGPKTAPKASGGSLLTRKVHVPHCVWRSPRPVVREFLRGLFESDGSASGGTVTFSSCKLDFVRDVQLLVLAFGINSYIGHRSHSSGNGGPYILHTLTLTRDQSGLFAERIGFIGQRKQALAAAAGVHKPGSEKMRKPNEMTDTVASVLHDGNEQTFDFTIGTDHVFSANGILTHNTDAEALSPRSLDKRLPATWLQACYRESEPIPLESLPDAPAIAELVIYEVPQPGRQYVIGCDPAEGLPGGDDTAIVVLAKDTGEQVAECVGKLEPKRVTPDAVSRIAAYYNNAECMVERNNHGHAVIAGCEARRTRVIPGADDRPGWVSSLLGKTVMYDSAADSIKNHETVIRSFVAFTQLASIDREKLEAPKGQHDDVAVSYALAILARTRRTKSRKVMEQ